MKLNKFAILSGITALTLGVTACNDDDIEVINYGAPIAPTGASIDGASGVSPRITEIAIDFNREVKTANLSKILVNDVVPDSAKGIGNQLVIYMPNGLKASTDYSVTLLPYSVTDADESLHSFVQSTYEFNFKTGKFFSKDNVSRTPVNPNITAEARTVYQYLYDNYGSSTLTGSMGSDSWGLGYSDLVSVKSGKYPAIVGFDYIHHLQSAAGENWIDYNDITPVKQAWEAGSIPAFTWHWRTPYSEDADPNNPLATFENVIYDEEFSCGGWSNWLTVPVGNWVNNIKTGEYLIFKVKDGATGSIGICDNDWQKILGVDYYSTTGNLAIECTQEFIDAVKGTSNIIVGGDVTLTGIVHADTPALEPKTLYDYNNKKFSPSAALTPGTPEHTILDKDIAIVAGYLAKLQDAGIPVLWRPLHEAAGDYTWGAWFWWGNDGVQTTKKLWIYLYDQLTNRYGLNNLIWVWNMQTSDAGKPASKEKLIEAYPGDQYVDIVGVDIYNDESDVDATDIYNLLSAATGERKILAISEIGNFIDFEQGVTNEACWSFFMTWYNMNSFNEWELGAANDKNDRKAWRKVMNLPFMKSRGEFRVK